MKCAIRYWFIFMITSSLFANENFPKIYAHRGYQPIFPENCLAGISYCMQMDVDAIDMDVILTKDHVVILYHDLFYNRCTTKDPLNNWVKGIKYVSSHTLNEVQQYGIGFCRENSIAKAMFPNQKKQKNMHISTLRQALELLSKSDKIIQIEIKDPQATPYIIQLIEHFRLEDRVEVQTNSVQVVKMLQSLNKHIAISYLAYPLDQKEAYFYMKKAATLGVAIFGPEHTYVDEILVSYCHAHNIKVVPWTINNLERMKQLITIGVDGIITDYPDKLIHLKDGYK